MNSNLNDLKTKIIDSFIIARIRILNFIKEHKYISVGIGTFLFSCVVILVAFASDDAYENKITVSASNVSISNTKDEQATIANSFSYIDYTVSYVLKNEQDEKSVFRDVEISAEIPLEIDAQWLSTNENNTYSIKKENGKQKIVINTYGKETGISNSETIRLQINNVLKGTEIIPTFTVKESTGSEDKLVSPSSNKITVNNIKTVELKTKVIGGTPYKQTSFDGRYIPYGILVGIDESDLENGSMEGLYFNPNASISLNVSQTGASSAVILEQKELFGVYDKNNNNLFVKEQMPHHSLEHTYSTNDVVYNSGTDVTLTKEQAQQSNSEEKVTIPNVTLVGASEITIEQGVSYESTTFHSGGIKIGDSDQIVCNSSDDQECDITIESKDGKELKNKNLGNLTDEQGIYIIKYKYTTTNGSVTAKRIVNVKQSLNSDEKRYYLVEGSYGTLTLDQYNELKEENYPGITDAEGNLLSKDEYEISSEVSKDSTGKINKYTRTYKILEGEEEITLTAVIDVINEKEKVSNKVTAYKVVNIPYGVSSYTPSIYINNSNELVACNSDNKCEHSIIDLSKEGMQELTYTIESDIFQTTLQANANIINNNLTLNINGIKSDGKVYYKKDNLISLGSYYVTVASQRAQSDGESTISVTLTANGSSDTVDNLNYDPGLVTMSSTLNSYDSGLLTKLDDNDYLAYGEETVVRTIFNYSYGDSILKNTTIKVPARDHNGSPIFEIIKYYSEATEENSDFFIQGVEKENIKSVTYNLANNSGEELAVQSLDDAIDKCNNGYYLANVMYEFVDLPSGTTIDLRMRMKVLPKNAGSEIPLNTTVSYTNNDDGLTGSFYAQTKIKITAFKARSKVFLGKDIADLEEQDRTINGSSVSYSTLAIYPIIEMPAASVTTNIIGTTELSSVDVTVQLPEYVKYIYDENYATPTIVSGNNIKYTLKNKKINEWIEPIYLTVSYDINTPSTTLEFKVITQATTTTGLTDYSSENLRTTTRNVIYQNNEKVVISQYTNNLSITNKDSFNINTKIFNNSSETISGLSFVSILPSNDIENSNYSGTYTLDDIPQGALCSVDSYSVVSNVNNYFGENGVRFVDCSEYKDADYLGVTAIKLDNINIDPKEVISSEFIIVPEGSKTGDRYVVDAFLLQEPVKKANTLNIEVISKKITGFVWEDFDSNWLFDNNEKNIEGVTLHLYDADSDELLDTTSTDEKGIYSFVDLQEGNYYIVAEYNTAKYGLSQVLADVYDKSKTTSFDSFILESNENKDDMESECEDSECDDTNDSTLNNKIVRTIDTISITNNTKTINNINLGLTLRLEYSVKLKKYVTSAVVTNSVGFATTKDFGRVSLAKLDVKDINNQNIKVIYTIELENVGYYPGYIYSVKDYIPDGMSFNASYEENKGWTQTDEGYIQNNTLSEELLYEGDKKYLTIAFDIARKEAGSFINYAAVEEDDLQILVISRQGGY